MSIPHLHTNLHTNLHTEQSRTVFVIALAAILGFTLTIAAAVTKALDALVLLILHSS
jgi:hypothetical protein